MEATFNTIEDTTRSACASLGAVCLRGRFSGWIDVPRADWFPVTWSRAD